MQRKEKFLLLQLEQQLLPLDRRSIVVLIKSLAVLYRVGQDAYSPRLFHPLPPPLTIDHHDILSLTTLVAITTTITSVRQQQQRQRQQQRRW